MERRALAAKRKDEGKIIGACEESFHEIFARIAHTYAE
jgi:hypothetical protein